MYILQLSFCLDLQAFYKKQEDFKGLKCNTSGPSPSTFLLRLPIVRREGAGRKNHMKDPSLAIGCLQFLLYYH